MNRLLGLFGVLTVLVGAMWLAAANAGHQATLDLGLFTLYRVPVIFVAFTGLFVGMVTMFIVGVRSDLKVRSILRERLREEAQEEKTWIDQNQQDLFAEPGTQEPPSRTAGPAAAMGVPGTGPRFESPAGDLDTPGTAPRFEGPAGDLDTAGIPPHTEDPGAEPEVPSDATRGTTIED